MEHILTFIAWCTFIAWW